MGLQRCRTQRRRLPCAHSMGRGAAVRQASRSSSRSWTPSLGCRLRWAIDSTKKACSGHRGPTPLRIPSFPALILERNLAATHFYSNIPARRMPAVTRLDPALRSRRGPALFFWSAAAAIEVLDSCPSITDAFCLQCGRYASALQHATFSIARAGGSPPPRRLPVSHAADVRPGALA